MPRLNRQQFLRLMAAGTASFFSLNPPILGEDAPARGPLVPWGRLKFVGENGDEEDWHVHPNGDLNLIDTIRDQTSLNLEKKWNVADIADLNSMVQYPFLFMHGEISPILDDVARQNLREYFLRGGFLFAEDCVNGYGHHGGGRGHNLNDFFFRGLAGELQYLIPGAKFEPVPLDHPVFNCFYHLKEWPHMQGTPHGLWGLTYNGRVLAMLSPSDLHCAWVNANWFPGKQPSAMQMGTNIYMYALTQMT